MAGLLTRLRALRTGRAAPGPAAPTPTTLATPGARFSGDPPSANGASSFHAFWDLPGTFQAVAATLEVTAPPTVDRLYFWALQVDMVSPSGGRGGGAHLGLQWHPQYPGKTAVNWGGYGPDGRILDGTASGLPGSLGNPHTRDYSWRPGSRYRLAVAPAPAGEQPGDGRTAWRGTVTDLDAGTTVVVRDLLSRADMLTRPMVWSEVFAACDHAGVEVRWSDFEAVDHSGQRHRPDAVSTNYQRHEDGGCANTETVAAGGAIIQRTNVARHLPSGTRLML